MSQETTPAGEAEPDDRPASADPDPPDGPSAVDIPEDAAEPALGESASQAVESVVDSPPESTVTAPAGAAATASPTNTPEAVKMSTTETGAAAAPASARSGRPPRRATLRLVEVDPWSVAKTGFALSVAVAIITIITVAIVWGVLGAAGLWDSINTVATQTFGDGSTVNFDIRDYIGTSRVMGFTMIVAVVDIVLITVIATLGAYLYNVAATLVGGVQVTFSEE